MARTKPPGSGRQAGTPNKTTREMRELAKQYGPDCIAFWASLVNDPEADTAYRLVAARELADRGYGKPSRTIELEAHSPMDYSQLTDDELAVRARVVYEQLTAKKKAAMRQLPEHTDGEEV